MKTRLTALALAVLTLLSLTACGPQEPAIPSEEPGASQDATSSATAPATGTDASAQPSESAEPSELPSGAPSPTPSAIGDPTAPPTEEPGGEDEPAQDLNAGDIYSMWTLTSSQYPGPGSGFVDMSSHLDAYYDLDADDLESFVFYQPDMSSSLQELFLAKAKPGKADAVKTACQGRLDGLKEEAETYPGTSEFVDAATLERVGDWVVLAACPEASRLVKILKDTAN